MMVRRKKVEIHAELVGEVLRHGYEVGLVKCTYGLPEDAAFINAWFEPQRNVLVLVFESFSWDYADDRDGDLPIFTPMFTNLGVV
jgi:hypothetical protein